MGLDNVDVWFQDEAIFGQQNTTTRLLAECGSRQGAVKSSSLNMRIYLAQYVPLEVLARRWSFLPWVNKDIMVEHFKQISAVTEKGRHAVVIMDGAGWHTNDIANQFSNVSIIKLPPYSPELNPIEQVWSWLRQHYLANQSFFDYQDIVSKVCTVWNRLLERADRVTKMCTRDWINLTS